MSSFRSGWRLQALMAALVASGCVVKVAAEPPGASERASRPGAIAPRPGGELISRVKLVAENAGSLAGLVNGPDAALISDKGTGLIANNGGGLVANNGGGLIANNGGGYRLASAQAPVAGARVTVYDDRGEQVSEVVSTDAAGRYRFSRLAPSSAVLFVVVTYEVDGFPVELKAAVTAPREAGEVEVPVDPATTLVSKKTHEMLRRGAIAPESVTNAEMTKLSVELAGVMSPEAVARAVLLSDEAVAKTFDDLIAQRQDLQSSLEKAIGGSLDGLLAKTPPKPPATPTPAPTPTPAQTPTPAPAPTPTPAPAGAPAKHPLPAGLTVIDVALPDPDKAGAALQSAIMQAGRSGAILKLPAGTFTLDRLVTLMDNIHLVGVPGQTVLRPRTLSMGISTRGASNCSLRDLVIDGEGTADSVTALEISGSSNAVVYRVTVRRLGKLGYGLNLSGADNAVVEDCVIQQLGRAGDGWGAGLQIDSGCTNVTVKGNTLDGLMAEGILVRNGSSNVTIENNVVRNVAKSSYNTAHAIMVRDGAQAVVRGNETSGTIKVYRAEGTISHNTVDGSLNAGSKPDIGIIVEEGTGVVVKDNTVRHVVNGLYSAKAFSPRFENNTVSLCTTGLFTSDQTSPRDPGQVVGNRFTDLAERAIYLGRYCDAWQITDNTIADCGKSGVYMMDVDATTIARNSIRRCGFSEGGPNQEAAIYWNSNRPKTALTLQANVLEGNVRNYVNVPAQFIP